MQGTLYIVATPLGNLGDLTIRATEVLRTVPCVVAEDTRRTRQLLHHLDAHPRLLSFHAHSDTARMDQIIDTLRLGRDVALVTDAGTPAVSDPGAEMVERARAEGFSVVPIPGVSAVTAALSASGLSADRYLFLGFIPRKGKDRKALLERAAREPWTVVFFEAPSRLVGLLTDLATVAGDERTAVVARELTKLHEEIRTGTLGELSLHYQQTEPRGEITLVLAGAADQVADSVPAIDLVARAEELLASGMTRKGVVQSIVEETGLPRNEVYRKVMDLPA